MTNNAEWSEDVFDVWLYQSFDAEGQEAWRRLFGLPKLLKNDNPSAKTEQNAEGED